MKDLLSQTMIKLARTTYLDNVTVTQIVASANIGRKTFYYHFRNIDDLIEYTVKKVVEQTFGCPAGEICLSDMHKFTPAFRYGENASFYKQIAKSKYSSRLGKIIYEIHMKVVSQTFREMLAAHGLEAKDFAAEERYAANYISIASANIIVAILRGDIPDDCFAKSRNTLININELLTELFIQLCLSENRIEIDVNDFYKNKGEKEPQIYQA